MWFADLNKGSSTSNMRRLDVNTEVALRIMQIAAHKMSAAGNLYSDFQGGFLIVGR